MRFGKSSVFTSSLLLTLSATAFASPRVHRGPTSPHLSKSRSSAAKPKTSSVRSIEPERATQIQNALIKAGYLTGAPSGAWDAQSEAAMQKLQADNGWQTKFVPDARAIIRLGLGPNAPAYASSLSPTDPPEPAVSATDSGTLPANVH